MVGPRPRARMTHGYLRRSGSSGSPIPRVSTSPCFPARLAPCAPRTRGRGPHHVVASARVEVDVQGHRLSLSNLDKVLYPAVGFTKGQVIDYYTRVAPYAAASPARPAADAEALPERRRGAVLLREALPVARARVGAPRGGPGDHVLRLRRPADARLARQPRRPRAAPVAVAGRRDPAPDRHGLRPRPGLRRRPAGVLRGRLHRCATRSRAWAWRASPRPRARRACRSTCRSTSRGSTTTTAPRRSRRRSRGSSRPSTRS